MSLYGEFQEIKDNTYIDDSMAIAIASVLKDEYGIKFSKYQFNTCKVNLTFNLDLYDFPFLREGMDADIWIMHKFGNPIKEFFKNIISDDTDLYLVDCRYTKRDMFIRSAMESDVISVNFYFEYFKQFKNQLQPEPTVYGQNYEKTIYSFDSCHDLNWL